MNTMRLGRTNLTVSRSGFGALPIQRVPMNDAIRLLQKAYDGGINFFDTARFYTDSEEKLGAALASVRDNVTIATKAMAATRSDVLKSLSISLGNLRTDHVDILQLHNPFKLPDVNDPDSAYAGLLEAREKGMTRFTGISCHSRDNAIAAVQSGCYDTVQFPLSPLSSEEDLSLVPLCREYDCGLIAMKALAGGLITNATTSFAFLRQYENVVPIWGIQRDAELDEFLALEKNPPLLDKALQAAIENDRIELAGSFCRGCGYCMPCPAGIEINWVARTKLLLRRAPVQGFLTDDWRKKMERIRECTQCGACSRKCPYNLDTPLLLKKNLEDYENFRSDYIRES